MKFENITERIIGCAIRVHRRLGPGLLESTYENCLAYEMERDGLRVERQKAIPLIYDGVRMSCGYRVDLLVNDTVVVEVKSVERLEPVHIAQGITYAKLTGRPVALVINFNVMLLKDGIRRLEVPP